MMALDDQRRGRRSTPPLCSMQSHLMPLAFSMTLLVACAGCFPFRQSPPRPDDVKRNARIDELGRRLDPKAELIQLEDTWLELFFERTAYRFESSTPEQMRRLCAYNLRAARMLFDRYEGAQKAAHAIESTWRFERPKFKPCRDDGRLGGEFAAYLARANDVWEKEVKHLEEDWPAAASAESLVLIVGSHDSRNRDETVWAINGQHVVGQQTRFEGFEVVESLGRYKVKANHVTRDVVAHREDRWALVSPGPGAELPPGNASSSIVLIDPEGTRDYEQVGQKHVALGGEALASSYMGTGQWAWVRWSSRRVPPGQALSLLPEPPDVLAVDPAHVEPRSPADPPKSAAEPAERAEPAPRDPGPPAPEDRGQGPTISPLVWTGFGVGLAGFIAGGVAGGVAASQASDLKDACGDLGNCNGAITQAELDETVTLAHVSTAGFAVGGAGVALGIVGLFLSDFSASPPPAGDKASVEPFVGVGGAGIRGRF
jgi:hypothetical protein